MITINKIKALFKDEPIVEKLPAEDVGWSERSAIYSLNDFEKYNPDDLIGRKGYGIYRKMMQDEQIKAVVKFKRDAVTSRDYMFTLDGKKYGLSDSEVKKRIALSYEIIEQLEGSWIDAINGIMSAIYNGFSMTEKIFNQIEFDNVTWWGLKKLKLKPYDTFYFNVDEFGEIIKIVQKFNGSEQILDGEKFIKYIVNPDIDEHYGSSELREAYRSWFSKDIIYKFRNMWLERHAGGFRIVSAKEGKTITAGSAEYVALQNALNNINTSTGIVLPNSVELKSEYPAKNVAYKEALDDCDTAIARALLVPNLLGVSPQGTNGSLAQSGTQLEAFLWTLEADAIRLEETINEQLFRQLAKVNFGDDGWPRFKFKPASGTKKLELINSWKELVTAGAVVHTDTDDKHLRELLEFPEAGEEIKKDVLTDDTGSTDTGDITDLDDLPNKDNDEGSEEDGPLKNKKPKDEEELTVDSTIIGKGLISVGAFSSAVRRVDFAVIAKTSDSITDEYTFKTAKTMDDIIADLLLKARSAGLITENVTDNIKALKVDSKLKRKLNSIQNAMLKEGFRTGTQHAALEIDKAKNSAFSRTIGKERIDLIAEDYFKMKAFKITGNLTDDAVSIIETEILNGAKYDKTWHEVEQEIYRTFASKGMISIEQAKDALGEALGVTNPDARIRTITRTSTFDAINEARHSYFTDPSLDGFVVGYEYSAILDGRTTTICKHLDEEDRGNHPMEWYDQNPQFRPPNHYNCRSLLIPVTELDEENFVEGGEPTVLPQAGFR
ncbi:DUF935 family protein [Candidatus Pacearchaeota archaeon]|nr:DUF935 family protein [Candidatus Pacearchaeota archaeon]